MAPKADPSTLVSMSLDDIIKQKRPAKKAATGKAGPKAPLGKRSGPAAGKAATTAGSRRAGGAAAAAAQRLGKGAAATAGRQRGGAAAAAAGNSNQRWQHDKFEGPRGRSAAAVPSFAGAVASNRGGVQRSQAVRRTGAVSTIASPAVTSPILRRSIPSTGLTTGTKVTIANLPNTVVVEDLQELFGADGVKLKSVRMVSDGVSEVVFTRREDAVAAVAKYDTVLLDGRAMVLKLDSAAPITSTASVSSSALASRPKGTGRVGPMAGNGASRLLRSAMQM